MATPTPLPLAVFPDWITRYAEAVAVMLQAPVDLPALLVLGAAAIALGGVRRVRIDASWVEPTTLFLCIVLRSGEAKSPAFDATFGPVYVIEAERRVAARKRVAELGSQRSILTKRIERLEKEAASADSPLEGAVASDEAAAAREELLRLPEAALPRLVADDVTPEALARLLAVNDGRIGLASDEGGLFEAMQGRYRRDGEGPNLDVFLKAYSGTPLSVDRIGRESFTVTRPALTVVLAVQPDIVESLSTNSTLRGRGLLARFGWSMPKSRVGFRASNVPSVPAVLRTTYETNLRALFSVECPRGDGNALVPVEVQFSAGARDRLVALKADLEPRLAPGADLAAIADVVNKLPGMVARIAGLFHLSDRPGQVPDSELVSAHTVDRAVTLGWYFLNHALRVFSVMGETPENAGARRVVEWLAHSAQTTFTLRDVHRACFHNGRKAEAEAALVVLVERGYLRPLPDEPRTKGGKSSPRFSRITPGTDGTGGTQGPMGGASVPSVPIVPGSDLKDKGVS